MITYYVYNFKRVKEQKNFLNNFKGNLDIGHSTHTHAKQAHYEINPQHTSAYQYRHPPKPAEWHFCHYLVDSGQLFFLYTTCEIFCHFVQLITGAPNSSFRENICSEDDLRSTIFGAFVVKFLVCLPLLGFSNIYKMV